MKNQENKPVSDNSIVYTVGFAIVFNIIFNLVIGLMTISGFATFLSRLGAFIITILAIYILLSKTKDMARVVRLKHFSIGSILYIILVLFSFEGLYPLTLGIVPCLFLFTLGIYFGDLFFKDKMSTKIQDSFV